MVQRFLDIYAAENRRPGRADQPAHYREQLETIRREAILAMVLRAEARVAHAAESARSGARDSDGRAETQEGEKSREEKREKRKASKQGRGWTWRFRCSIFSARNFLSRSGRRCVGAMKTPGEFWHDLELYENLTAHGVRAANRAASARAIASGPFVDRTALLLDPSLMEQARRAAGKFQLELNAAADRVLRNVFSRRRAN